MTVEEILAALQAIIDQAGAAPLTNDQAARYEELEKQLAVAQRDEQIRARQRAYTTPVRGDLHVHVAAAKPDDTLDRAFDAYLRTGTVNADLVQLRAQSVGSDAAGGYLVPPGFRTKLVEVQKAFGGFANAAESLTTDSGTSMEYPSNDDTANSGAITAEGSSFTGGADLTFGTVTLDAFKYTSTGTGNSPLKVSVELLQDSAFDIAAYIARKLGERIYRKQATDFMTGSGSSEPDGILRSGLTQDASVATPGALVYNDLIGLEGLLDPAYEPNASWLMSKSTWVTVRKIVDGSSRPIILDQAASGMRTQPEKTLFGYAVVLDQASPSASGGAGRNFIAFGDFREAYVIRHVRDVQVIVNPYSSANNGQVEYVAWARADGTVQNRSAFKVLKG